MTRNSLTVVLAKLASALMWTKVRDMNSRTTCPKTLFGMISLKV